MKRIDFTPEIPLHHMFIDDGILQSSPHVYVRIVHDVHKRACNAILKNFPFKELKIFRESELKKVTAGRYRGLVVDRFSIYAPYHVYKDDWGAYIRINAIKNDMLVYMIKCMNATSMFHELSYCGPETAAAFAAHTYIYAIFKHIVGHHVLEDIALMKEIFQGSGEKSYPLLDEVTEECLCNYFTFSTKGKQSFYILEEMIKGIEADMPLARFLNVASKGLIGEAFGHLKNEFAAKELGIFSDILYYHWRIHEAEIRACILIEKVKPWIIAFMKNFFNTHLAFLPVVDCEKLMAYRKAGFDIECPLEEVYERIFLTRV